jgi:glutathione-regulated potassium-efflux system ancillary protein KefF
MITVIYAHPYPQRSHANRTLLSALSDVSDLSVRSLYDLYPDFAIDVEAEQRALVPARVVLWQCPLYWYSVPPLLKLWFDKVLAFGWAYGEDAHALRGKLCRWVVTTGGDQHAFSNAGVHGHAFDSFVTPVEQTARFCGMRWQPPFVLHHAHRLAPEALELQARELRAQLLAAYSQEVDRG